MKEKLTQFKVDSLKPQAIRYEVCDTLIKGLSVRVSPDGTKTYSFRFRRPNGKQVRVTLGDARAIRLGDERSHSDTDARGKANQIRAMLAQRRDPIAEREAEEERAQQQRAHTLGAFIEGEYAEKYLQTRKRGNETLQRLKACFGEFWNTPLSGITPDAVQGWIARRQAEGRAPGTINRDVVCLRGVFTTAFRWGRIERNPLQGKVGYLSVDKGKEARVLSTEEEKRLMEALEARQERHRRHRRSHNAWLAERGHPQRPSLDNATYTDALMPMVELSLQTGLRQGEIYSLEWRDIDFDNQRLIVRGEVSKTSTTRYVPLNGTALHVLDTWRSEGLASGLTSTTGFVFPSPQTGGKHDNRDSSWRAVLKAAKIENFRWHDLRATAASRLVNSGANLLAVMRVLGHRSLETTKRYLRSDEALQFDAMNRLDRPSNVVSFPGSKGDLPAQGQG